MQRPPDTIAGRNFQTLWDAARTTLKDYRFPLYRQDRRDGVLTTRAVASSHLLEQLWRKDAATMFHLQENTFHTIYRAARVRIRRIAGTDEFDFTVEVAMARSDAERQVPTASSELATGVAGRASGRGGSRKGGPTGRELVYHDLLGQTLPPGLGMPAHAGVDAGLVPLGRDQDLEYILSQQILQRAGLVHRPLPDQDDSRPPAEPAAPAEPDLPGPIDEPEAPQAPVAVEPPPAPAEPQAQPNESPDQLVPLTDLPPAVPAEPSQTEPPTPPAEPAPQSQPASQPTTQPSAGDVQAQLESLLDESAPTDAPATRPADEPLAPPSP